MQISKETILGDIVAENYQTAEVLEKYQLDFCCHGTRSLAEACLGKNLDTDHVARELQQVIDGKTGITDATAGVPAGLKDWPLDLMADYVEKTHHRYVTRQTPLIEGYLNKIVQVHGGRHPELSQIRDIFLETAGELAMHMKKEELMLFPFIRKITVASINGTRIAPPPFGSIANPVNAMLADHEAEGERSAKIRQLCNDFNAPDDACNTYRLTFRLLQEFEQDLHQHIHIENNILFPKSIELEPSVLA
ncbi:regulator of cell morphogenesis and NO signaling [Arachidicoccus rhizosphaerae]|uniref:Regulator of cell morphogenesis and NO signaling n=1 Tax=Arachidicoccus rhizosphaerae TaxID=551991 RepID=A0A1H4B8I4_9BACT|nr:iron-sulfur cluster repair di-iron protein [Arachidicoccus rhizosphaerae]SEA44473.1 regulator of cell morphogenesis and NO signaling [Arachidicoccus rhizosphaerae]